VIVKADRTDDREITLAVEDDAHSAETRLSQRQARRLLIDLAHAVDGTQRLYHERVLDAADLISDREGVQFKCPVCQEKFEQDADDSPGYVPRLYLGPSSNSCYECGTDFEIEVGITEADDGAE